MVPIRRIQLDFVHAHCVDDDDNNDDKNEGNDNDYQIDWLQLTTTTDSNDDDGQPIEMKTKMTIDDNSDYDDANGPMTTMTTDNDNNSLASYSIQYIKLCLAHVLNCILLHWNMPPRIS